MPSASPTTRARIRRQALVVLLALLGSLLALPAAGPALASDVEDFDWSDDFSDPNDDVPGDFEGYGDAARFRFFDGDLDPALSAISVVASSTSDPVGVLVEAERAARTSAYYRGAFTFSPTASDPLAAVLHVRDGDTVTVTYREPRDAAGQPRERSISRTWFARTRAVDFREVGLVAPSDGSATLHGAAGAAPAGSLVRLYPSVSGDAAVASATADSTGRFRVDAEAAALDDVVSATAQEPGLTESRRLSVKQARLTGRVSLPDVGLGVQTARIELRADGDPDPCEGRVNCGAGPWLTARDGRFYTASGDSWFNETPGRYDVFVKSQGVPDEAPWGAGAYGSSGPFPFVLDDGSATQDVGELPLRAPNLFGRVEDAAGVPVVEAMVDLPYPDGQQITGAYTRADGRFAVWLPDGDYQMRVRGPFGCVGYAETTRTVSVRDGVATPAEARIVLDAVHVETTPWKVPLDPPDNGVVVRLDGPGLTLRLDGAGGPGVLSVRCTSDGWDAVTPVTPPVEISWDGEFDTADVCLLYQPERAEQAGLELDELELLHRGDDGTLTALPLSPGSGTAELCGTTESFSSFAVGSMRDTAPAPQPPPPPQPAPAPPPVPQARATDDSCPPGVPEDGFTDLPDGAAHEAAVDCIVWWRLAQGRTPQTYAPTAAVTRAQMATFIANLVTASGGSLPAAHRDHFDDDDGDRHEDSINRLAEAGIVSGQRDGSYGPQLPVRRDQMATFLVKATERRTGTALPRTGSFFPDDDGTTHESRIDQAAGAGFTGGGADGRYAPSLPVRRDQMGSFLARVLDLLVEQHGARTP